jgi:hypothetical protein
LKGEFGMEWIYDVEELNKQIEESAEKKISMFVRNMMTNIVNVKSARNISFLMEKKKDVRTAVEKRECTPLFLSSKNEKKRNKKKIRKYG